MKGMESWYTLQGIPDKAGDTTQLEYLQRMKREEKQQTRGNGEPTWRGGIRRRYERKEEDQSKNGQRRREWIKDVWEERDQLKNSKRNSNKFVNRNKSRGRPKVMDEEKSCGKTKSTLHHTKYFTESLAYSHKCLSRGAILYLLE